MGSKNGVDIGKQNVRLVIVARRKWGTPVQGVKRMLKLAGVRNLFCATALIVGGFILPHTASAATLTGGGEGVADFGTFGSFTSLTLSVSSIASDGSVTVDFDGALSPLVLALDASNTTQTATVSFAGGPVSAEVHYTGSGTFDTSHLSVNGRPDLLTPIPAALPLFLTGTALLYGVARGRKAKRRPLQVA